MKRFTISITLILLSACTPPPQESATEPSGITFVHLNDTYRVGAVTGGREGGFGRVITTIRNLQAAGREVHVLHGGDFLNPSLESQLWNGMQMVDAMNYIDDIAPMHVVLGNHEIDRRTPEHFSEAVRESRFDWLGDNYRFETGADDVDAALRSTFTIEYAGRTVGFFAITAHENDGGNQRDYVPIEADYVAAAEAAIRTLEERGVDAIIGVTHLYMRNDRDVAALRAAHPKFLFIVGGHDHEPEYSPMTDENAAILKGASNARSIWTIDLNFDEHGTAAIVEQQVVLDESVARDADYQTLVDKWRGRLTERFPFLDARVGEAAVPMDGLEETVRTRESNWANFIVDQMPGAFGEPHADLAFLNGGTLRIDDVIAGDIRFEDIGRTFGFSSFLRRTTVSGHEFRQIMENGYRGEGGAQGFFPQITGFRVCIDRRLNELERIVSLQVPADDGWAEIDDDRQYSLVVPDFLFRGGDGYEIPKDRPASRPSSELKYLVLDAILIAQARGEKIGAPVDPMNPRYVELSEAREECWE